MDKTLVVFKDKSEESELEILGYTEPLKFTDGFGSFNLPRDFEVGVFNYDIIKNPKRTESIKTFYLVDLFEKVTVKKDGIMKLRENRVMADLHLGLEEELLEYDEIEEGELKELYMEIERMIDNLLQEYYDKKDE